MLIKWFEKQVAGASEQTHKPGYGVPTCAISTPVRWRHMLSPTYNSKSTLENIIFIV